MRLPKLKYNDIIEIIWLDATSDSGWRHEEKVKKDTPAACYSVGYYVTQDKTAIVISPDWNNAKERSSTVIPFGMIQKIRKLK